MKHDSECEMYSEACGCESRKQKDAEIASLKEQFAVNVDILKQVQAERDELHTKVAGLEGRVKGYQDRVRELEAAYLGQGGRA